MLLRLVFCVEVMFCSNFVGWDGGVVVEEVMFVDILLFYFFECLFVVVKIVF